MSRRLVVLSMVVIGFATQAAAYLLLATPIGRPTGPRFSNPRVPYAPAIFVAGVMLVFLAAVVYEIRPHRKRTRRG